MKQHPIALILSLLLCACGGGGDGEKTKSSSPPDEKGDPNRAAAEPPAQPKRPKKDDPRIPLLEAEWKAYTDQVISHGGGRLEEQERQMLFKLVQVSKLIEELYMLQLHPDNLTWRDHINATGLEIEKRIFNRYQSPWCEDNTAPDCTALEARPAWSYGAVHWPDDFKSTEYPKLKREINAEELLSPFTVVRRNPKGGYLAIPYARTTLLGPKLRKAAALLRDAASLASEKTLSAFLSARADAFESEDPFPYDASDILWIGLKGDWEVTVGPYEVYRNPYQTKALFEMIIGRENQAVTQTLAAFKADLQEMENSLQDLVGEDVYKPRKLAPKIAIRAIDVWMASGDARRSRGATVAYHLPNRGQAVDEGLYKKVILVNHKKAFEPVTRARAEQVLRPDQRGEVDHDAAVLNTTFHELAHGFGAFHEMSITNKEGKRTTVKQALREHETLMEELKADTVGLWLMQNQQAKGALDEAAAKKRYTSQLLDTVGLFQYPLQDTYARMAAIELGWYLDAGALSWHQETGQFSLVYEKMPQAVAGLAKRVSTLQLQGDYAAADALVNQYITKGKEAQYWLSPTLSAIRKVVLEKFKSAGIKSPSLRYEIRGI